MSFVIKMLEIGISPVVHKIISESLSKVDFHTVSSFKDLTELSRKPAEERAFHICFVGPECEGSPNLPELIQKARMVLPTRSALFYASESKEHFDRVAFKRNGCQDAYLLPMDHSEMVKTLAAAGVAAEHSHFSPVRLVDIEPNTVLDFDVLVFLSLNNRFVTHTGAGDKLTPERLGKLHGAGLNSIYVPVNQLDKFYDYSAKRLQQLNEESQTGLDDRLRNSIRELITGMLSESYSTSLKRGQEVAKHSKHIAEKFILTTSSPDAVQRIKGQIGTRGDAYSHSSSIATFAALFGVLLRSGKPEDLVTAGLFHDIGLTALPLALQEKNALAITDEELVVYIDHPAKSIEIMQQRKLIVPGEVMEAVANHHERCNGKGYPKGLEARRISEMTQILILADSLEYLTRAEGARVPLSLFQALKQLERENAVNIDLISKMKAIFAEF